MICLVLPVLPLVAFSQNVETPPARRMSKLAVTTQPAQPAAVPARPQAGARVYRRCLSVQTWGSEQPRKKRHLRLCTRSAARSQEHSALAHTQQADPQSLTVAHSALWSTKIANKRHQGPRPGTVRVSLSRVQQQHRDNFKMYSNCTRQLPVRPHRQPPPWAQAGKCHTNSTRLRNSRNWSHTPRQRSNRVPRPFARSRSHSLSHFTHSTRTSNAQHAHRAVNRSQKIDGTRTRKTRLKSHFSSACHRRSNGMTVLALKCLPLAVVDRYHTLL